MPGRHRLLVGLAAAIIAAGSPVRAEETVSHAAALQGPAAQVVALAGFDPTRGELLRVRLTISGTARGAVAHYGALGKKFTYRGRFALSPTANFDETGFVARIQAYGVDRAPPSPDSLSAVDWHVAVYGNLDLARGLQVFAGHGPLYLLYTGEKSVLSVRGEGHGHSRFQVHDSTLEASVNIYYHYRPAESAQ